VRKITKCEKHTKVLRCKFINRATGPKPEIYSDNGDVSEFLMSNYFGLRDEGFIELVGVELWH